MKLTGKDNRQQRACNTDKIQKFKVTASGSLLEVVRTILKDHTPTKVKSMLKHHQFAINGTPISQFDHPVNTGDELAVKFGGSFRIFTHPKIKILYEDSDIIIIEKGVGILATTTAGNKKDTVYDTMRKYVGNGNGHARIYMVHRLDRDTSGIMLLARTSQVRNAIVKNWGSIVTERKYEAIVDGIVEKDQGLVQNYLYDTNNYEVMSSDDPDKGALAKTRYVVLERSLKFSRVELSVTHNHKNQLRVHMKDLGHPISGDKKYGGRDNGIHRLALHATKLGIIHPTTGKEMHFSSPAPTNFTALMRI